MNSNPPFQLQRLRTICVRRRAKSHGTVSFGFLRPFRDSRSWFGSHSRIDYQREWGWGNGVLSSVVSTAERGMKIVIISFLPAQYGGTSQGGLLEATITLDWEDTINIIMRSNRSRVDNILLRLVFRPWFMYSGGNGTHGGMGEFTHQWICQPELLVDWWRTVSVR